MGERIINPIHNVFKQYRKMNLVNPYWFSKPFESTWRTSTTSTGSSTTTQVKLPLVSTGTYSFVVNWGDGTTDTITVWNQAQTTHTYSVAGDYTIKITGTCTGWQFNNTGDKLKILSIASWGTFKLGNINNQFNGCGNLNLSSVSDVLDLTGTTSLAGCFVGCTTLTTINRINEWNTSLVTNMSQMFSGCSSFNSLINGWNTGAVTDMSSMFTGCLLFNQNLSSWNTSNVLSMASMFFSVGSNTLSNIAINSWNVTKVTNMSVMFQNSAFNSPLNNWVTSALTATDSMFRNNSVFNQNIGNFDMSKVLNMSFMFSSASAFNNGGSSSINGWNTGLVTNMTQVFSIAIAFNQNIGSWNVSSVVNFTSMFNQATAFNNGGNNTINNWVLKNSGTILMASMFNLASAFNQPLGNWNTQFVTNMSSMFASAIMFNQDISSWNTVNVTTMVSMFNTASAFNNGLSSGVVGNMLWSTNSVTSVNSMFQNAVSFNQNLGALNLVNCTDFGNMFLNANKYNNGGSSSINSWTLRTASDIGMSGMFRSALVFNQNIGAWNVSRVIAFQSMFRQAIAFNNGGSPDINNWTLKTTGSIDMNSMFLNDSNALQSFNQPIGNWNTIAVTNMASMFQTNVGGSIAFNQNIGTWNVSSVVNFTGFMNTKTPSTFSTTNLDAIYNGWSALVGGVKPNLTISFGTAKYTAAGSAGRAILTGSPNLWTITDGGI